MNMDNLFSIVLNNLNTGMKLENIMTGQLNLSDFMPENMSLKTGHNLLLSINQTGSMLVSDTAGQKAVIPENALTLDKNVRFNEPVHIEVKIGQTQNGIARLQVLNINGQDPQSYVRGHASEIKSPEQIQAAIIKDISTPQNIPLKNLSLAEAFVSYIDKLPIPQNQKTILLEALRQIEIKAQVSQLLPDTENATQTATSGMLEQKIAEVLNKAFQSLPASGQIENHSQIIQETIQQLMAELQPLAGSTISSVVTNNVFSTVLGNFQTETALGLPEGLQAELEIIGLAVTQPPAPASNQSPLDKILGVMDKLKAEQPQIYRQIAEKLPSDNEKMLGNMISFVKAAAKGDVTEWLGKEAVQRLTEQGESGRAILTDLQNALQNSTRQSPAWRVVEIPYYIENHMEKIKLAVKQYPDEEENNENPHEKFGTRFVVDTNFSLLGAFQFDGFSFAKDHRFDLIIRTEKNIGDDLCANIMRIFKTTLSDVGYVGNIKLNLKENFIKISENNDDKILTQGLLV